MVNYSKKSLRVLFFLGIFLLSGCVWPLTTTTQNPDADSSIASIVIADAQAARDAGMLYIRDHYGLYVPPAGSAWIEQNITPEGVVGTSAFQFNIDHWVVNIIYPMVNPAELIFSISVHNPTTGFTWEGQVDAFGIVIETARPNDANRATKSPTPTTSVTPSAVSSTQIFSDSTYRFSVQYPSDWALTISPAGYVTSSGGFAAKSINLTKDGYTLKIQYKFLWEKTELGESLPSGTLEVRGPATLLGRQIPQQVIVDQGQDKVSFYGDSIDDISYHIRLETQADSLPAEIQQIAAQIVSTITRTGPIVSSPTPTLTPSITVTPSPTSKLDASKSGVGSNSTVSEDCNLANFISHVTIPEGAAVPAGARFIKTWRV